MTDGQVFAVCLVLLIAGWAVESGLRLVANAVHALAAAVTRATEGRGGRP